MNILFLSYWGIEEGLTKATVLPHIEILSKMSEVKEVYLSTIERHDFQKGLAKNHIPLISRFRKIRFVNKVYDFVSFPRQISQIIKQKKIDFLICRGAPAGAIGHKVYKKTGIPYAVESFEPHAEYMLESGVWERDSLSYKLENKWELEQIRTSKNIICVSDSYKSELVKRHSETEKFKLAPCAVDINKFQFSAQFRDEIREALNIQKEEVLGIYVGKFGGLYLEDEAVQVIASFLNQYRIGKMLILSPVNSENLRSNMKASGVDMERVMINSVDHSEVPKYLSAADAALALYKPSNSKRALSPIKIGEYWANGLPVLIPEGIGDDSSIIFNNRIGTKLNLGDIDSSVRDFVELVKSKSRTDWTSKIVPFAKNIAVLIA